MIRTPVLIACAALLGLATPAARVVADEAKAAAALNAPLNTVQDSNKSWRAVLGTAINMSAAPAPQGKDFSILSIWPGMKNWDQVKAWAAANPDMGKALLDAQKAFVFGMPYGRAQVPPEFAEKGVFISIGEGRNPFVTNPAYLKTLDLVGCYVAAEMYRLGQEKKFDEAFALGLAALRVWRQAADQQLLEEKRATLEGFCALCSIQRDFIYTFLADIPPATLKKVALDGYAFVRPSDAERMRRLEMPEGDRVVADVALTEMFDDHGQPDGLKMAAVMAPLQSRTEPLTMFGAARRWSSISEVHGSLDATKAKLTSIYDDWWRRWRVRYFDPLLDNPTALSRTNKVRYAMVLLIAKDLESVFVLRKLANAELNGTVLAAGLAAWNRELGTWPRNIEQAYTQYIRKRFDYDPFDPKYGRWNYQALSSPKVVDCEYGRIEISGCELYAVGQDKEDGQGSKATNDGLTGDLVAWPPLRAVSRQPQGAAKP
ncbi:MAG: hypothetical protein U0636_06875 [Phycisphaerales bacterium]